MMDYSTAEGTPFAPDLEVFPDGPCRCHRCAMNGIASLEQSQRVKALGFEQNHWPQMVWEKRTGPAIAKMLGQSVTTPEYDLRYTNGPYTPSNGWCASPPLISGDPEAPGVVEWMERKGWEFDHRTGGCWYARPPKFDCNGHIKEGEHEDWLDWLDGQRCPLTLPALIDLVLTEMEKG